MTRKRTLTIKLKADATHFQRAMFKVNRTIARVSKSIGRIAGKMKFFGLAVGAGFAILVRQQFKALDATAKLSDRIDIQTDKLAGLNLAASQTGVGAGVFVKSIEKMQQVLGDATLGLDESKKAFRELKLSYVDLSKGDTFETLLTLVDALNKKKDPNLRAALAADIFGRAGAKELRNFLDLGSKGIRKFVIEARKLGHAFTRIDLAKVEAANDAIDKLKKSVQAAAGEAAIQFSSLLEGIGSNADDFRGVVVGAFQAIDTAILDVLLTMDWLEEGFASAARGIVKAAVFVPDLLGITPQTLKLMEIFFDLQKKAFELRRKTGGSAGEYSRRRQAAIDAQYDTVYRRLTENKVAAETAATTGIGKGVFSGLSTLGVTAPTGVSGLASARSLGITGGLARFGGAAADTGKVIGKNITNILTILQRWDRGQVNRGDAAAVFF